MCLLGPRLGGLNRHFKPNMRKILIAISSDLCIRLTWNLTGSCGQQQRLRGWSRKTIPRWRTAAILKIVISPYLSEKSSDFHEILYTAADFELDERHVIKNEKVALDKHRVRQNVFLVYLKMLQISLAAGPRRGSSQCPDPLAEFKGRKWKKVSGKLLREERARSKGKGWKRKKKRKKRKKGGRRACA